MDWLEELLKDLENADELQKAIAKGIGENFVSKADFNNVNKTKKALEDDIKDRDEQLEALKEIDAEGLQAEITRLQAENKTAKENYEKELSDRDFNDNLEKAINAVGAKNVKAVKALLDIDALKDSKNQDSDIKSAIEACQKDNDYLFGEAEPINNPVGPTGGDSAGGGLDAFKAAASKITNR